MTLSLCNHLAADSAYQALRRDVLDGFAASPKSLPPKWFYDSVGSDLFDQITRLPEYYPTRAEAEILRARSAEIASVTGADTPGTPSGASGNQKNASALPPPMSKKKCWPELAGRLIVLISRMPSTWV